MDILVSEVQGEMANQFLQMGDQNTADVKLQLLGQDGVKYEGINPLYLHSHVLTKSEFYKRQLSSDERQLPIEIKVRTSHYGDNYIRCLELMYSSSSQRLLFDSLALIILLTSCLRDIVQ